MLTLLFLVVSIVLLFALQVSSVLFNHLWPQQLVKVKKWRLDISGLHNALGQLTPGSAHRFLRDPTPQDQSGNILACIDAQYISAAGSTGITQAALYQCCHHRHTARMVGIGR